MLPERLLPILVACFRHCIQVYPDIARDELQGKLEWWRSSFPSSVPPGSPAAPQASYTGGVVAVTTDTQLAVRRAPDPTDDRWEAA